MRNKPIQTNLMCQLDNQQYINYRSNNNNNNNNGSYNNRYNINQKLNSYQGNNINQYP